MKKLLTLTILLTTFIQADEEANKNIPDICFGYSTAISEKGIKPCKENDIFIDKSNGLGRYQFQKMFVICKVGTIDKASQTCRLRAEKDFAKEIDHDNYHK